MKGISHGGERNENQKKGVSCLTPLSQKDDSLGRQVFAHQFCHLKHRDNLLTVENLG